MPDLEKTIKGLECCKKLSAKDPFSGCDDCPYNEISVAVEDCRAVLCADALKIIQDGRTFHFRKFSTLPTIGKDIEAEWIYAVTEEMQECAMRIINKEDEE